MNRRLSPISIPPSLYRAATGRYYLLVKRGGKQFRRSLKTNDFALVTRRLREFQEKAGRLSGESIDRAIQFEHRSGAAAGLQEARAETNLVPPACDRSQGPQSIFLGARTSRLASHWRSIADADQLTVTGQY
jgi:hypothetical protein